MKYVARLIKHFGDTPLSGIDQASHRRGGDRALSEHDGPGTRNACVYTPVSAILRHAKVEIKLRRPIGAKGRIVTDWLTADDAFGIIAAAELFDAEYALLLKFLLYTGVRLGAALNLQREDIQAEQRMAWVRHQKGQPASNVLLREDLRDVLVEHIGSHNRGRVFRFHQGGHLKHQLVRAKLGYLGLPCPSGRKSAGVPHPTDSPGRTTIRSGTPGRRGCGRPAWTCSASSQPATGAIPRPPHATPMPCRVTNGARSISCRLWGKHGDCSRHDR